MVEIINGVIKGLNGTNLEIAPDELIAFRDKARNLRLDDAAKAISLENQELI